MAEKTYIYVATQDDTDRLIRARNGVRAKAYAASNISVRLASQDDLQELLSNGSKVEDSTKEQDA